LFEITPRKSKPTTGKNPPLPVFLQDKGRRPTLSGTRALPPPNPYTSMLVQTPLCFTAGLYRSSPGSRRTSQSLHDSQCRMHRTKGLLQPCPDQVEKRDHKWLPPWTLRFPFVSSQGKRSDEDLSLFQSLFSQSPPPKYPFAEVWAPHLVSLETFRAKSPHFGTGLSSVRCATSFAVNHAAVLRPPRFAFYSNSRLLLPGQAFAHASTAATSFLFCMITHPCPGRTPPTYFCRQFTIR